MPGRNEESSFSRLPNVSIHRAKFPFKVDSKFTGNVGDLIPFLCEEVLPGDTFNLKLSKLVRLSTSIHPTMDNLYLDTYFFFVPNRLVWDNWQKFMGENDQAWAQNTDSFVPPYLRYCADSDPSIPYTVNSTVGSLLNYLGIPIIDYNNQKPFNATILDLNAYLKVYNDWFRDENLLDEIPIYKGDGMLPVTYWTSYATYLLNNFGVTSTFGQGNSTLKVARFHDYFTSALPAPQKGADVLIPAAGNIGLNPNTTNPGVFRYATSHALANDEAAVQVGNFSPANGYAYGSTSSTALVYDPNNTLTFDGLKITVNGLRLAMQTQRLLERDARSGTRYTEILKGHFGVTSPDARLQRSEYLGGKRTLLNMSEVLQTSESTTNHKLGDLAGRSSTADQEEGFIKSFVEHGYIIGVCCVRTDNTYSQGLPKRYSRFNRLEYYWPVLANIGEQPIYNKEIMIAPTSSSYDNEGVFGYQEPWAEYRYKQNRVAGFFAPGIPGTLDSWHYGTNYSDVPNLSSEWLKQGVSEVDRTLAYPTSVTHQLLFDFYTYGSMVRPMPVHSVPGLVDHN